MKRKELERKYKNEWVLVEVLKENEIGEPIEVKLLSHSKNRDEIYKKLRILRGKYISTFYTGKIPKKGYAVAFYGKV